MVYQQILHFKTAGRGTLEITEEISQIITQNKVTTGLCHLFLHHTSASLILCENADATVREDLERYLSKIVQDGDKIFKHNAEGEDDMSAHVRTVITGSQLTIPITQNKLALGTWQGVFLYEHRQAEFRRKLTVTILD